MLNENKIAAAILAAALAPRATDGQPIDEAQATTMRLYHDFLAMIEKAPATTARRTNEEWRVWAQQIMGVLPH
jgi:hypothetical protein